MDDHHGDNGKHDMAMSLRARPKEVILNREGNDHDPHGHTPIEQALEEVREATRELDRAHHAEEAAEKHLEKAVHDLEKAQHQQEHTVELIINTRQKPWTEKTISYEQVVALSALPLPQGANPGFTIVFQDGPRNNVTGTLTAGHSVHVKNEMVFDVTPTNRA